MKINHLIIYLFAGVIFLRLMAGVFLPDDGRDALFSGLNETRAQNSQSYEAASISEGTILLLLAVGVIGALGVSRKKKGTGNRSHRNPTDRSLENPDMNEGR